MTEMIQNAVRAERTKLEKAAEMQYQKVVEALNALSTKENLTIAAVISGVKVEKAPTEPLYKKTEALLVEMRS